MKKILETVKNSFNLQAGLIIALTAVLYGLLLNNLNLWTDEIYSVLMAKDSLKEMFHLLMTEDSKPPLYYLYLKGILALFPRQYEIFGAHFASYILLLAAQIFTAVEVKRDYGDKIALWLIVLIGVIPHSLWLAFEVRTYMFSNLFMFMALIYGLRLSQRPQKSDFIKLGIAMTAALYSHYYCALWLMFLCGFILFFMVKKHDYENLKHFLITSVIVAILFAPWLYVPFKTGGEISANWYVDMGFVEMTPMFFYDPLAPEIMQSVFFMATFWVSLSFSFIILTGCFNLYKEKNKETRLFYTAVGTFFLTYALLLFLSFTVRPMVAARYLKIFSLIWYIAGAVTLVRFQILQKVFLFVALCTFPMTYSDVKYVSFDKGISVLVGDMEKYVSTDQIILALDNSNLFCEYYLPKHTCLLAVGEKGEILRLPSLLKKKDLYLNTPQTDTLVLSMHGKPYSDDCLTYQSEYRNGYKMNLCKMPPQDVKLTLEQSLKLRLNKY